MQPAASSTSVKIEFAQASDPGRDPNKQVNEDSCGYAENHFGHLCVLCDGMGGHHGGKEASRLAITTIFEVMEATPKHVAPSAALKAAIEAAALKVYELGGAPENRVRPGSTVVAMLIHDAGVDVAHVGDSRAYVIRAGQIYPLTRDHSMVQGMIDAGMLTEAQAIGHPDANKITRALGMKPHVDVEVRPEPMELFRGDVLLQSSDGLTDLALSADILGATRQALASGTIAHACNQLVHMANDRGGHDNITVQMLRVSETAPRSKMTIAQAPSAASSPYAGQGQARPIASTAPDASGGGWGGVAPTAADRGAAPSGGVARTVIGDGPQSAPVWSSGSFSGPQSSAQPNPLDPYRVDGMHPLPPRAPGQQGGHMTQPSGPTPIAQTVVGPTNLAGTPMPPSVSMTGTPPSNGGIVFIILGLSIAVAVLILLLIWALFLR